MSHQTGIKSNAELREHFGKARDVASTVRLIKVQIDTTKEEMKFVDSRPIANDWRTDYRAYMGAVVEKEQPCYIFFRLDNLNNLGGHDWVLVLYLPITAAVRSKMLYASTKTTLKNDFGTRTRFDYLAEAFEDIAYETFAKWMVDKTSKDVEFTDEQERVLGNASAIKMSDLRTVVEEERHKIKALELAESAQKSNKYGHNCKCCFLVANSVCFFVETCPTFSFRSTRMRSMVCSTFVMIAFLISSCASTSRTRRSSWWTAVTSRRTRRWPSCTMCSASRARAPATSSSCC